jgi:hypothetical protein
MPADRNWGLIRSGETFESLVTTLVFFTDPEAELLGRRGRDGGQDALSGDGLLAHQAKFHERPSAAKAIADAKAELEKIRKYRTPGHVKEPRWKSVKVWRLWTNAAFNDNDADRWKNEVVVEFKKIGLEATYYEVANINALLDEWPAVDQSYFEGRTRVFLSIPEARKMLADSNPSVARGLDATFRGRATAVQQVIDFAASDKSFLLIHGQGGIGKTRLALEAGEDLGSEHGCQVLWANVNTMERDSAWLRGIIPERRTVLIVDEPETDDLLSVLVEQVAGIGRAGAWKVVVVSRTPKDPVVRFLRRPSASNLTKLLPIDKLDEPTSKSFADELLLTALAERIGVERRLQLAQDLARWFDGTPVWITLAVDLIDRRGHANDIPQTTRDLARKYVREIVERSQEFPPEQIRTVLRWIALRGKINVEDKQTLEPIGGEAGIGTQRTKALISDLVERRALIKRGAFGRLREIAPDVLRDNILLDWLTEDVDQKIEPSDDVAVLVQRVVDGVKAASLDQGTRAVLDGLVRAELILRFSFETTAVLDGFFDVVRDALPQLGAASREVLTHVLGEVAYARPRESLDLCSILRAEVVPDEVRPGPFRETTSTHSEILLNLPSPLVHAAMVVDEQADKEMVLKELLELAQAEYESSQRLPNDGGRASQLLAEVIHGGPRYRSEFSDAVGVLGARLLEEFERGRPTAARLRAAKQFLDAALSFERTQVYEEGQSIVIRRYKLYDQDPAWRVRHNLLSQLRSLLEAGSVAAETRKVAWGVFASANHSLNRLRDLRALSKLGEDEIDEQPLTQDEKSLLADLEWAAGVLEAREHVEFEELLDARELWDWYQQFEKKPALKAAAMKLEVLYTGTDLAREFEPLTVDDSDAQRERVRATAGDLAGSPSPMAIAAFLERADRFFGDSWRRQCLRLVALELGEHAEESETVQGFVRGALGGLVHTKDAEELARLTAWRWITVLRRDARAKVVPLVEELEGIPPTIEAKAAFLKQVYGWAPFPRDATPPIPEEIARVRTQEDIFRQANEIPGFVRAIAGSLDHDWPSLKPTIEHALENAGDRLPEAISALVEAVYWALERDVTPPPRLGAWLLDQVLRQADLDATSGRIDWWLRRILKKVDVPDVVWFADAIARRLSDERRQGLASFRALGVGERISSYVTPISETDAIRDAVHESTRRLVRLAMEDGSVGYRLPEHIVDIDPNGLVVPDIVIEEFGATVDAEHRRRLARVGGAFPLNSDAWRRMARPMLSEAAKWPAKERGGMFFALADRSTGVFRRSRGAVAETFVSAVEHARTLYEQEEDETFRPLWLWRLDVAEDRLRAQEEEAKEERGE